MKDHSTERSVNAILTEERRIVRWWMDKIGTEIESPDGARWSSIIGAFHELRTHLKRRYDLEESDGLFDESFVASPRIAREMKRIFDRHHELEGRLEVLLHDLEAGATPLIVRTETVRRFIDEWTALEQSETGFFQRVAYEEYGAGD